MGHQNVQRQDMSLVLSSDAKPRLKWTPELHQRFVDTVAQLGGPEKATPKSLMRLMGISGLTLYHLKSHLQKYRLGKSQQSENYPDINQQGQTRDAHFHTHVADEPQNQINDSTKIAQALHIQMEVQKKLHHQIEVQRHLQLRIEAQGKYLHSVLKKAQETISGYNSSAVGVELAKAELAQLVSMVDNGCNSSSVSVLTDVGGSVPADYENNPIGCSLDSSLTSSENSGRKRKKQAHQPETEDSSHCEGKPVLLSLIDLHPSEKSFSTNQASGKKRSGSTISDANCVELVSLKRSLNMEAFDLNSQYVTEFDSCPKGINLN